MQACVSTTARTTPEGPWLMDQSPIDLARLDLESHGNAETKADLLGTFLFESANLAKPALEAKSWVVRKAAARDIIRRAERVGAICVAQASRNIEALGADATEDSFMEQIAILYSRLAEVRITLANMQMNEPKQMIAA